MTHLGLDPLTARIQHHLSVELEALNTEPVLSSTIVKILFAWRRGDNVVSTDYYDVYIRPVILEQCHLGWENFVFGRWCPAWRHHQAIHYAEIGSRKSSLRWATAIIHKLLLIAWDLWQYRNNRHFHAAAGPHDLALY